MKDKRILQSREFIKSFNKELRDSFEDLKPLMMNPNTKGAHAEKKIADILSNYLGSAFDFHVRGHLLDYDLDFLEIFHTGSNEIDIIATFTNALPKIIMKKGSSSFIPYDGIAFIVETKYSLTLSNLRDDLVKLDNISKLKQSPPKKNNLAFTLMPLFRPLRFLLYFDKSIDNEELTNLLDSNLHCWDAILIINDQTIILNRSLPMYQNLTLPSHIKTIINKNEGYFITFLNLVTTTIPHYWTVDTMKVFSTFLSLSQNK